MSCEALISYYDIRYYKYSYLVRYCTNISDNPDYKKIVP